MPLIRHALKNVEIEYDDEFVTLAAVTFTAEVITELCSCGVMSCPCSCIIFHMQSIQFEQQKVSDAEKLQEVVQSVIMAWMEDQPIETLISLEIVE